MLSDVVGPSGHVYGLENAGWKGAVDANNKLLAEGKWKNVSMDAKPFGTVSFPKPLDVAWITQNYHDLKVPQFGNVDTVAFDRAVYKALKPGGIFFVLDHQGAAGLTNAQIAKLHRINRDVVVKEVTSAGFKLVGEGNFLRRSAMTTAADLRQGDPGSHRPICIEVREAGALSAGCRFPNRLL